MSTISQDIHNRIQIELSRKGISANKMLKDCSINTSFMNDLKNKRTTPSVDKILIISEYLHTSLDFLILGLENLPPTLRGDEKRLLRLYNELDDSGRRLAMVNMFKAARKNKEDREWWETHRDAAERLLLETFGSRTDKPDAPINVTDDWGFEEDEFEKDDIPFPISKSVAVYYQPASAGTGTFLDSDDYELIDFPIDRIPIQTTFGVRISGDSMMPDFENEDIVFVKQQRTLEDGEIGVLVLNGDAFLKKLMKTKNKYRMISLNPKYEPIDIHAHDELRVVGKVIGKHTDK